MQIPFCQKKITKSRTVGGEHERQGETSLRLFHSLSLKKDLRCKVAGVRAPASTFVLRCENQIFSPSFPCGKIHFPWTPSTPEPAAHLTSISLLVSESGPFIFNTLVMALPSDLAVYFVVSATFGGIWHSPFPSSCFYHLLCIWSASPWLFWKSCPKVYTLAE